MPPKILVHSVGETWGGAVAVGVASGAEGVGAVAAAADPDSQTL